MLDLTPFAERYFYNNAQEPTRSAFQEFHTDIRDMGDHFLVEGEFPGYSKEEIHIELDGDYMTITAQHAGETQTAGRYLRRERANRPLQRSFDVSSIYADGIHASYENGVLTLVLPKKEAVPNKSRHLEIH